ncbi:MAG: ATP-dependent helicase [Solirubrobacterales bacterium]|nr:ATP-dependent helicase [Solirubrobacterales bacterium]
MFDVRSDPRSQQTAALPVEESPWFQQLNAEQRAAVRHPGGPLLILAGAGTGKTTTLCGRVAWLVADGVAPERILLLTFTRRAAREMLQRARALVAMPSGARGVQGGTFHSVAHHFVRRHSVALGLPAGFGVLDAGDAADLLDLVREEHGHAERGRRFPKKSTLLDIYSRTVNAQRPLSEVLADVFPWCEERLDDIAVLFKAYTDRKRALGVIDLDDLLLYWRGLATDEVVGAQIEARFDHVLIDEYQDVNGLQVDIVRHLRQRCRNLTAVGDDFQAIYGWRAASARHILDFPDHFPDATVVTLESNYRSTPPILSVANALSAQAERAFPKQLRTERAGGVAPQLIFCRDESAQASEIADRVLEARERAMDLRQQAALMRTSHDSALLELELSRRQIPFVKYGGLRYLEAAHVKDLIALFRLADNPHDEISWFRVLQLLDGVGPATARRVLDVLVTADGDELAAWLDARQKLPADARPLADGLIEALRDGRGETAAGVRAERLSQALAPLIKTRYPDGALRLQDLDQLVAAARGASALGHFVSELVIDPPASSSDLAGPPHLDEDYVVLSTIHSAKGLEWDAVHVLALYDGNFPACMSAGSTETIDEERRLLYVAMTRARRQLHLYVPVRYYHRPHGIDDAHGYGKPSRFLTDEVQRCCNIIRPPDLVDSIEPPASRRRIEVSVDSLFE